MTPLLKPLKAIYIIILLFSVNAFSQGVIPTYTGQSPTVSALLRFNEIPVSNHTGIPNVSIPLINIPSHSKDISVDLTLGYHPSAIAATESAGDVGLGWSLFSGGVISRDLSDGSSPDEYGFAFDWEAYYNQYSTGYQGSYHYTGNYDGSNFYQYNFMGYSGSFILQHHASNTITIKMIDNKPSPVSIAFTYNPTTFVISSFTVKDKNGYTYIFDQYDEITGSFYPLGSNPYNPTGSYRDYRVYRPSYHLTSITDANQKTLISYVYKDVTSRSIEIGWTSREDMRKKLSVIDIKDKGKVFFKGIEIVVAKNNDIVPTQVDSIKKYKFTYGNDFKSRLRLYKLEESNFVNSEKLTHLFEYKENTSGAYDHLATDKFGYFRRTDLCGPLHSDETDINTCTLGVLEKITYPGGGYTFFDYESNTYSDEGIDPDNPGAAYYNDLHNNSANVIYPPPSITAAYPFNFIITNPKTYYFTAVNPGVYNPNFDDGHGGHTSYSSIKLLKKLNTSYFAYPSAGSQFAVTGGGNNNNDCYGSDVYLEAGTYKFDVSPLNPGVSVEVRERKLNPIIKKWHYGGGIRIKKISYYDGLQDETPVKELNYGYTMFNDPLCTSGGHAKLYYDVRITGVLRPKKEMVAYKNVTVSETGKGRSEYTYINTESTAAINDTITKIYPWYEYKVGLELNNKHYDNAGTLLKESSFEYEFDGDTIPGLDVLYEKNGWVKKKTGYHKNYFYNNGTVKNTIVKEVEAYNSNKMVDYTITNADSPTDAIKTQYTYSSYSVPNADRIINLDKVETYRNQELISTNKTTYSNTFSGNVLYLPQTLSSAKGSNTLTNTVTFLSYDDFSNPLALKQEKGMSVCYIWGYNKTLPIAKIENATYSQVSGYVSALQNASNNGSLTINSFTNLRNALPSAMITTYIYKPLIGVTSITDPKGLTVYYEYDGFGRLKFVRDHFSKIISENVYHYKPTQN